MRAGLSRKRHHFKLIFAVIFLLAGLVAFVLIKTLEDNFLSYANDYAQIKVTQLINAKTADVFKSFNSEEFQKIQSDRIVTDTAMINELKSQLTLAIQNSLNSDIVGELKIPIGSVFGISIFHESGPGVPVKIRPTGLVTTDFEEEFQSEGINYVKYSLYLNVGVDVRYNVFLQTTSNIVRTSVPIIENISIGTVPNYYGLLDDIN